MTVEPSSRAVTTVTGALTAERRLQQIALSIQGRLKITAEQVWLIGRLLAEAKVLIGHGQWEHWLTEQRERGYFNISPRSAQNYIRLSERLTAEEIAIVAVLGPTLLYRLTAKSADPAELDDLIDRLKRGEALDETPTLDSLSAYVSEHVPQLAARIEQGDLGVKAAYKLAKAVESVPPAVREVALVHQVSDPAVVPILAKVAEVTPLAFAELAASGCLQGSSDPIPLAEANSRDIQDFYTETRFHNALEQWAEQRTVICQGRDVLLINAKGANEHTRIGFYVQSDEDLLSALENVRRQPGRLRVTVTFIAEERDDHATD